MGYCITVKTSGRGMNLIVIESLTDDVLVGIVICKAILIELVQDEK